jgi:DNA modification methylase
MDGPNLPLNEPEVWVAQDGTREWHGRSLLNVPWSVYEGDATQVLRHLPRDHFACVVTSPPYFWLRDYGADGQIGKERRVEEYVCAIADVMDEVHRVLRPDGSLFLNMGDTYYSGKGKSHGTDPKSRARRFGLRAVDESGGLGIGLRPKTIIGVPWRVAVEMMRRKWVLRSPIIWHRKNCLPEYVTDRPKRSYEFVFMFVKGRRYYYNAKALASIDQEDMWTIPARPKPTNGLSTAPFPDELVVRCLDLGCAAGGAVLDPFAGSGTALRVALESGRPAVGIDLARDCCEYMVSQLRQV